MQFLCLSPSSPTLFIIYSINDNDFLFPYYYWRRSLTNNSHLYEVTPWIFFFFHPEFGIYKLLRHSAEMHLQFFSPFVLSFLTRELTQTQSSHAHSQGLWKQRSDSSCFSFPCSSSISFCLRYQGRHGRIGSVISAHIPHLRSLYATPSNYLSHAHVQKLRPSLHACHAHIFTTTISITC